MSLVWGRCQSYFIGQSKHTSRDVCSVVMNSTLVIKISCKQKMTNLLKTIKHKMWRKTRLHISTHPYICVCVYKSETHFSWTIRISTSDSSYSFYAHTFVHGYCFDLRVSKPLMGWRHYYSKCPFIHKICSPIIILCDVLSV